MKRKFGKLTLSRETLGALSDYRLRMAAGGVSHTRACASIICGPIGDTGTESGICTSKSVCSNGCQTGGEACTATCTEPW
jgi:hypothetical protein